LQPILAKPKPRTIVYIDGFNLYYGAVKGTPWKWLDLAKLFTQIRAADEIQCIRYFTAMVNGPSKPRGLPARTGHYATGRSGTGEFQEEKR
jgi:hypothetical protein